MMKERSPTWVRVVEIVLGLLALGFGVAVILMPALAVLTLILLLSLGLLFLGWREIFVGAMRGLLPVWLRAVSLVAGVLTLILSAVVIAEPTFAVLTLVLLLYLALFVRGIGMLVMGGMAGHFSNGMRGAYLVVGILSIGLAIVFIALPALAVATLIFLLSIGLLVTGIEAIAAGAMGREIVPSLVGPTTVRKI